jgi:hypothetical protein
MNSEIKIDEHIELENAALRKTSQYLMPVNWMAHSPGKANTMFIRFAQALAMGGSLADTRRWYKLDSRTKSCCD